MRKWARSTSDLHHDSSLVVTSSSTQGFFCSISVRDVEVLNCFFFFKKKGERQARDLSSMKWAEFGVGLPPSPRREREKSMDRVA